MAAQNISWVTPKQKEKFDYYVQQGEPNECWIWAGPTQTRDGYGRMNTSSGRQSAHRMAYQFANGEIPIHVVVRHTCDNPACCNPAHLQAGTPQQNVQDRVDRKRSASRERNGRSKLNEHAIRFIRSADMPQIEMAKMFGVSAKTISDAKRGINWASVD